MQARFSHFLILNIMTTHHSKVTSEKKWSAGVTKSSDALDLKANIFESKDPEEIARSLKNSAEESHRRKSSPFRSAMSMLTFYINRAGKNLEAPQKEILETAKEKLRVAYGHPAKSSRSLNRV